MCQSVGNSSMCSGMQQVEKVTYEPSSEPFLIISRSILQEYLLCECIFFVFDSNSIFTNLCNDIAIWQDRVWDPKMCMLESNF